eukprot:TRINITY_DN2449_c1_g2_i6.p2 TRINITY_DN2449_c1_g2~~TRINITY_DN2449_c1_g2_i6.p2  ORF type:complete len:159 (+),score=10.71 TRINITY_DN2449_c1_g2_i6:220-696(+)
MAEVVSAGKWDVVMTTAPSHVSRQTDRSRCTKQFKERPRAAATKKRKQVQQKGRQRKQVQQKGRRQRERQQSETPAAAAHARELSPPLFGKLLAEAGAASHGRKVHARDGSTGAREEECGDPGAASAPTYEHPCQRQRRYGVRSTQALHLFGPMPHTG